MSSPSHTWPISVAPIPFSRRSSHTQATVPSNDHDRTDESNESDATDENQVDSENEAGDVDAETESETAGKIGADPARDVFSGVKQSPDSDAEETAADDDTETAESETTGKIGADPARDVFSSVEASRETAESDAESDAGGTETEASGDDAESDVSDANGMAFCRECGEELAASAPTCPHCGAPQDAASLPKKKDPGIAALASIIVPGAGQFYNGQFVRGAIAFVGVGVVDLILVLLAVVLSIILIGPLFLLLIPVVHILVAYDAYDQAGKINRGEVDPDA